MRTTLKSPLHHLSKHPSFEMELELTGAHHRQLLQGNKSHYERVAASVIQDLLGPKVSVNDLSLPELFFAFFMAKASTLGPVWKFDWQCPSPVIRGQQRVACSHKNVAEYNITKVVPGEIKKDFKFSSIPVNLPQVEGIDNGGVDKANATVRVLTIQDEFDLLDSFLGKGDSREMLLQGKETELFLARISRALVVDHPSWANAEDSDKEKLLDSNSLAVKRQLMAELALVDKVGFPMELRSTCAGCGTEVTLRLPFLAGILVQ